MSRVPTFCLLCATILTVALSFEACNRKIVYTRYAHVRVEGWERNDTVSLLLGPVETTGSYAEQLLLHTCSVYPFTNLTLIVEQPTRSDTINCSVSSADGVPMGQGTSFFQHAIALPPVHLEQGDSLPVHIVHFMKRELLPGIADLGFSLRLQQ